jgi:hypothetical protein
VHNGSMNDPCPFLWSHSSHREFAPALSRFDKIEKRTPQKQEQVYPQLLKI